MTSIPPPAAGLPRHVGIIGAGIAGLTLALLLKAKGLDLVVFEVRPREALLDEGAFLTLAPNAMNGFRSVGLYDKVYAAGIETIAIELLDERGKRLGFADQSDYPQLFGAPSVTIARGVLMSILIAGCEHAGVELHFGASPEHVDNFGDRVRVMHSNGEISEFAWLAACDGLRSPTRRRVFPEFPKPRYSGLIGTGGVAHIPGVASTEGIMRMVFGHVGFFGYLKRGEGPVYWFNSYPRATPHSDLSSASHIARLRQIHRADPSFIDGILARVGEPARDYPLFDMPALPAWHRGHVVLLGDAAHAVGPHAGQGAAMAIEDAVVLASCVSNADQLEDAFSRYEALRRQRLEEVARLTARNRSQKRATTWFERRIRRLMLPLLLPAGIKSARSLCAYRVDTDRLVPTRMMGAAR